MRILAVSVLLVMSVTFGGSAAALPSPTNTIFVLYADDMPEYDVVRSFSTTAWNKPTIHVYGISESDLLRVLGDLADAGAISPDEPPLPDNTPIPDTGDFVYSYGPNPNSPYEHTNAQWLQDMEFLGE